MTKSPFITIILMIVLATACQPSRNRLAADIKAKETRLFSPQTFTFDRKAMDSLVNLYNDFATRFPDDSLAPSCLFKAASVSMNTGNGNKAIDLFDRFIQKYPRHPKSAMSLFFKAYIYENDFHNLDKAKETYLLFIEKYPKNEFVKDANIALQNLGKTPEQMIQEFEARKQADSLRKTDSVEALKGKKKKRE